MTWWFSMCRRDGFGNRWCWVEFERCWWHRVRRIQRALQRTNIGERGKQPILNIGRTQHPILSLLQLPLYSLPFSTVSVNP
ncbi:Protein of unknown function [Pyronema omphalodes CBS 100304]|uniref:Uncharacterized protein n=1 Tax=Pyronema omphalodes (strain CBS 100304) TaxID=1076935 RepID=U4LBR1_PYROM|nr:Protein of unknown function [Pyronema omphalodes CBS 100304]